MKLTINQLRNIIKEAADPHARLRQGLSEMSRALRQLEKDLPEEGLSSDIYEALDEVDAALRNLASKVPTGGAPSSMAGKGVQQKGHWLGSRWVPED